MPSFHILVHGRCQSGPDGARGFFVHRLVSASSPSEAALVAFAEVATHDKYRELVKEWGAADLEVDDARALSRDEVNQWQEMGWVLYTDPEPEQAGDGN